MGISPDTHTILTPTQLWSAAPTLSPRPTGHNAYFGGLGKEIQDEIIARESHRL